MEPGSRIGPGASTRRGRPKVGPDFSGERGKVAVKLNTGEKNNLNNLPRDMVQALLSIIPSSTIVKMNTLYPGDRDTTEKHLKTLKLNG